MLNIISKTLADLSKEEKRRLHYLTLKRHSLLRDDVLYAKERLDEFQLFLALLDEKIVGWSAVFPEELSTDCFSPSYKYCLYTYVQSIYRRQRIGRQLMESASAWASEKNLDALVFPWDIRSERFFVSCGDLPVTIEDPVAIEDESMYV